jgi:hypothetical protein
MNAGSSSSSSSASSDCPSLFEKRGRRRIRDCATGPSLEEDGASEDDDAGEEERADGEGGGRVVLWGGVMFVGR